MENRIIEIYRVTNLINGKKYVGQTKQGVFKRLHQHSKADSLLGRAIRKYGIDNFTIEAIAWTNTQDEANDLEHEYVLKTDCVVPNGYNTNEYGRLAGGNIFPSYWFVYFKPQYINVVLDIPRTIVPYFNVILSITDKSLIIKKNSKTNIKTWTELYQDIRCVGREKQRKLKKFLEENELITKDKEHKTLKLNSDKFKVYY